MLFKNIFFLACTVIESNALREEITENEWNGMWFPHIPGQPDSNPPYNKADLHDSKHIIKMGVKDDSCDDAKTNLELDWLMNPENYTCYDDKKHYLPRNGLQPIHTIENIPLAYSAPHICMNETIHYSEVLPTFGPHRPLWAIYGEYQFLPKQRWIHNLEHGAVVMLYHPCANKNQVEYLKKIVKSCLFRHIITPYNLLSSERPLALVSWGHRLEMSKVSVELAANFIKNHALQGPEDINHNGQYDLMLKRQSDITSDENDSQLCSFHEKGEVESSM